MEALLITRDDVTRFTALGGNVDTDKFIQFVKIAQDTHIQNYLGTNLLERLQADIIAGTLANPYLSLLTKYIKPMLIHWAMVEYLPFSAYTIANKGVYKHTSENAETVLKEEVDFLVEKSRDLAQHYTQRFIEYICFNNSTFPEYTNNSSGDMYPDTNNTFSGWYL
jgi:hypothetical protein